MQYFACVRNTAKTEKILESALFFYISSILAEFRGFLLHAYGLTINGLACAIAGPSGAGKSTAGRLMQKDFILSDDIIGITDIDGTPYAHATPLASSGITDGPSKAPLAAIFFPKKAKSFAIRPLLPRQAFTRYLNEHADYVGRLLKPYKAVYFELAHILFQKVPAYELYFPKDYIDTEEVKKIMVQSKPFAAAGDNSFG